MPPIRRRRSASNSSFRDTFRTWNYFNGTTTELDHYDVVTSYNPRINRCEDIVGNRHGDNDFLAEQSYIKPTVAAFNSYVRNDGYLEGPEPLYSYTGVEGVHNDPQSYVYSDDTISSDEEFVTHACASTNPSAAVFDTAVFAAELRDIPSLLHSQGGHMSKYGANEFLKFQYGWKPLVKDMKDLVHSFDKLSKRLVEIERNAKGLTVKRRFEPYDGSSSEAGINYTDTHPFYLRGEHTWNRSVKRWCVINWVPEEPDSLVNNLLPMTRDLAPLHKAKQVLLGGTVDGNTLWQAMPWSWLLDWGYNTSDYLESKRNIIGAEVGSTCLMKTTAYRRVSQFVPGPTPPGLDFQIQNVVSYPGTEVTVSKERIVGIKPSIVAGDAINLINSSVTKQSILGALGLQRLRRLPKW